MSGQKPTLRAKPLFRGARKRPIKRPPKKGGRRALFRGIWDRPFLGSGPAGRFQDG